MVHLGSIQFSPQNFLGGVEVNCKNIYCKYQCKSHYKSYNNKDICSLYSIEISKNGQCVSFKKRTQIGDGNPEKNTIKTKH